MTPAEHDALARVAHEARGLLRDVSDVYVDQVADVIRALRQLAADPEQRPAVLVALGLDGEGKPRSNDPELCRCGCSRQEHTWGDAPQGGQANGRCLTCSSCYRWSVTR